MMNKDSFDMLPPEHQQALLTAGEGLADEFGRILTDANARSVKILQDKGTPVLKISDEDRARLTEGGKKYIGEWIQRADAAGLDGQGLGLDLDHRDFDKGLAGPRDDKGLALCSLLDQPGQMRLGFVDVHGLHGRPVVGSVNLVHLVRIGNAGWGGTPPYGIVTKGTVHPARPTA